MPVEGGTTAVSGPNSGSITVPAGINASGSGANVTFNGVTNQGLGTLTIGSATLNIPGAQVNVANFQSYGTVNIKAATAFSPDYVSLDYSLQLQIGISRAVNAGQASLPAALNTIVRGARQPRPVATKLQEVARDQE